MPNEMIQATFLLTWSPSRAGMEAALQGSAGATCTACLWPHGGTCQSLPTAPLAEAFNRLCSSTATAPHLAQRVVEHVGEGVVGHDLVAPAVVHPAGIGSFRSERSTQS